MSREREFKLHTEIVKLRAEVEASRKAEKQWSIDDECYQKQVESLELQLREIADAAYEATDGPMTNAQKGRLMGLVQKHITNEKHSCRECPGDE